MNLLDQFKLAGEQEDFEIVGNNIRNGIEFKGSNLWILIFAIFIASLGLNVNSTAVIIGAMLVSPLMGPIMGLGFGMAINDLALLRKSFMSYLFAATVGLATSALYFLVSPLNEAHSEILARTSPNVYDVLIALFGGLAGMMATSSKLKGNVIPGVAIATALMPPLCTAGYGLATLQFRFFFGAFYLFLINTVFIALATLLTARLLNFPVKHLLKKEDELKARRMVWLITLITLLPSIYFAYDIVQQNRFQQHANRFIDHEAVFPNDYLLKKSIDAKNKSITLTYGGQLIQDSAISRLQAKLGFYGLENAKLSIRHGFAYLQNDHDKNQASQLTQALGEKEAEISLLKLKLDSLTSNDKLSRQLFNELKVQYPVLRSLVLQPAVSHGNASQEPVILAVIGSGKKLNAKEQLKIEAWMKIRVENEHLKIFFE